MKTQEHKNTRTSKQLKALARSLVFMFSCSRALVVLWSSALMFLWSREAAAQGGIRPPGGICPTGGIQCLLEKFASFLTTIGPPIAVLMIIVGALQILLAAGSTDKIQQGKRTITYAVVGLIIVLVGAGIQFLTKDLLGG